MGIQFNGNVTINGNVEMFDNGSMKITNNEVKVSIDNLIKFIEDNLKDSPNKKEYLESVQILKESGDKGKIRTALMKIKKMGDELGRGIWITGLSQIAIETIRNLIKN